MEWKDFVDAYPNFPDEDQFAIDLGAYLDADGDGQITEDEFNTQTMMAYNSGFLDGLTLPAPDFFPVMTTTYATAVTSVASFCSLEAFRAYLDSLEDTDPPMPDPDPEPMPDPDPEPMPDPEPEPTVFRTRAGDRTARYSSLRDIGGRRRTR